MKYALRNLSRVRHAVALSREGNFARAAGALNITQSALSRSIMGLEEDLGFAIFDRRADGAVPSEKGAIFLKGAVGLLASADTLEETAIGLTSGQTEKISFGLGPLPASVLIAELHQLTTAGQLRLGILVQAGPWLLERLNSGSIEFAICVSGAINPRSHLVHHDLGEFGLDMRVREGHPLLSLPSIRRQDLLQYPYLAGGYTADVRKNIESPTSMRVDPVFYCDDYHALAKIVRDTDAVCAFASTFPTEGLAKLRLDQDVFEDRRRLNLVHHRSLELTTPARTVVERITEILELPDPL